MEMRTASSDGSISSVLNSASRRAARLAAGAGIAQCRSTRRVSFEQRAAESRDPAAARRHVLDATVIERTRLPFLTVLIVSSIVTRKPNPRGSGFASNASYNGSTPDQRVAISTRYCHAAAAARTIAIAAAAIQARRAGHRLGSRRRTGSWGGLPGPAARSSSELSGGGAESSWSAAPPGAPAGSDPVGGPEPPFPRRGERSPAVGAHTRHDRNARNAPSVRPRRWRCRGSGTGQSSRGRQGSCKFGLLVHRDL